MLRVIVPRLRRPYPSRLRSLLQALLPLSSPSPPPAPPIHPPVLRPLPPFSLLSSPFSTSSSRRRRRGGEDAQESESEDGGGGGGSISLFGRDPTRPPRLFVVQPRLRPDSLLDSKLAEALNLAKSLEEPRDGFYLEDYEAKESPPHLIVQNPSARGGKAHADTYFGPGTVDNIKCQLRAMESENGLDAVFVNAILSGIQQRNLEVAWGKPVLDRVGLIIEIFNAHAETKEAKLQSELAALMYAKSRLVRVRGPGGKLSFGVGGEAEVVSARGRGTGGGRGFTSGAGETELQLQRRRIQERRNKVLSQIEEVRRTRALQRSARKRHGNSYGQGLATVAFVGYTNAGKSTLVSALSESDLYSDDRLFATVDPRLRSVILPSGRKALLSDTVGFISDLPIQLVEAFHATLEEVVEADILVHVLDSSAPNLNEQRETVLQVLQQIGVSDDKIDGMIEVWNKVDLLDENNEADKMLDQEDLLGEDEDEVMELSEEGDDMESVVLSSNPIDEDHMTSELSQEESPESVDDATPELSCGDMADVSCRCSSQENLETSNDTNPDSFVTEESKTSNESNCGSHLRTSAVVGLGLKELLKVIDQKLNAENSCNQESFGFYDKKWRPCNADLENAAEH